MRLESNRLYFRYLTMEDFDNLSKILSDKETMMFYPKPYDEKGVKKWIEWCIGCYKKRGFGLFAVILKSTGEFIGDAGITLQEINGKEVFEIGYHINKNFWNNGYATEAARYFKDYFFNNTNYDEVYSYMNIDNIASRKVAENNDMNLVDSYFDKKWNEHLVSYSITRKEWLKNK